MSGAAGEQRGSQPTVPRAWWAFVGGKDAPASWREGSMGLAQCKAFALLFALGLLLEIKELYTRNVFFFSLDKEYFYLKNHRQVA